MTAPIAEPSRAAGARLAVLCGAVLWGSAGAAVALGPDEAAAWQVAAIRLGVGATLLLAGSWVIVLLRPPRGGSAAVPVPRPRSAVAISALAMACFQLSYFVAVGSAGVALGTAVAIGSAPVVAGALQRLVLGVALERGWWPATGLAVGGVALLLGGAGEAGDGRVQGIVAGLVAGASFATFTVASRRVLQGHARPVGAMSWMLLGAAVPLVVTAVVTTAVSDVSWAWTVTAGGLGSLAWLVLAATIGAYALFGTGLAKVPPASAATLVLAEPLTAVVLGVAALGERLRPAEASGVVLVLAGLVLLVVPRRSASRPAG